MLPTRGLCYPVLEAFARLTAGYTGPFSVVEVLMLGAVVTA